MAEIASAFVTIAPSAKGFGSKLNSEIGGDVDSSGKKTGARFGSALKVGALGVLGGAALIGGFLKGAVGEARDAQKVGALTNAVIKSTGGVANVTAKDVDRLATSISLKTGVDDEAIAAGQNMLLTFGNVRNEVGKGNDIFSQATVAATDMAAAFGGDAVSNSKMLGKALNDPTKGVSALTRVGVSFTEQQKEQIKTLQASGDTIGAQKIILGELSKQTAGAAESQATSGDKFKTAFGNLQESVGTVLLPILDKALDGLSTFVVFLTNDIGPGIAALNGYLAPAVTAVREFFGGLSSGNGAVGGLISTLRANLVPVIQTVATTFKTVILPAVTSFVSYVATSLFPVFTQVAGIITGKVLPILSSLAQFFYGQVIPAFVAVERSVAAKLKPVFDQLVATFRTKVLPAIVQILDRFREWQPTIQRVILVMVKIIGKVLEFAATILGKVLPPVIRFAGYLLSNVVPAVLDFIEVVAKIIQKVIAFGGALVDGVKDAGKFLSGVKDKIGAALTFVAGIPDKIVGYFEALGARMYAAGGKLMGMLASGIKAAVLKPYNELKAAADKLKGLLPGSPIKEGPLKPWNNGRPGEMLMEFLAKGIAKGGEKTRKALEGQLDKLKSSLSTLKSDFTSLAESVSSSFTGNLFEATTAGDFIATLTAKKGELTGLLASFKTLKGWGIPASLLSQLFASGNGALITELAGMGQSGAVGAANLFGDVQSLGNQLGSAVATNDYGPDIREQTAEIKALRKDIAKLPKAVEDGAKKGTKDGNDDRTKDTKQRERAGR